MKYDLAVVTGASSGIGYEFAKLCAKNCNTVVLVARRREKLHQLSIELEQFGCKTIILPLDLTLRESWDDLFNTIRADGSRLDLFFNNAGFGLQHEFVDYTLQEDIDMVQLNVMALMALSKLACQFMLPQGRGILVNVASVAAFQPGPTMANYFATKSYVLSLSQALDRELKDEGLRVICLCPGSTDTDFHKIANTERQRWIHRITIQSPKKVAQYTWKKLSSTQNVLIPGILNKISTFLGSKLPRKLVIDLTYKAIRRS